MYRWMLLPLFAVLWAGLSTANDRFGDHPPSRGRFIHSGDGRIQLSNNKDAAVFQGRYRKPDGGYDKAAYQAICRVFGAPCTADGALSLRLIEFIDALEDHFSPGAQITITSGYRSPTYNTHLRKKGRLAAKASLHQYGMAADFKMSGVSAKRIWAHVKALGFGGTGYYQGETVHIDVGPARSWDQNSSGVGTGISDDNKLIGLVANFDVYRGNDEVILRFIRMTAFPIGVSPQFFLYRQGGPHTAGALRFVPWLSIPGNSACPLFENIDQMDNIRWDLPIDIPPGRYRIGARFCNSSWPEMPAEVFTSVFEVVES